MTSADQADCMPDGTSPRAGRSVYQCVCGRAVEFAAADAAPMECPACRRRLPERPDASMMSIEATVLGDDQPHEDSSEQLPAAEGDRLDHFTVLDLLGAGGMGAVFRARDESLQRFVALKVIRGRRDAPDRRERLIQEARAQARVTHPGVVHIYYVGIHHDCPFFAMELVNGTTLSRRVSRERLPFDDVVRIALQTAEALQHSAMLGIVHGDVKPGNILLDHSGRVKLSDFGLASVSDEVAASPGHTGPAGTLNYMAPEVAAGQQADIFSDMYSLGVMLYELTFGDLPHETSSDSLAESLRQRKMAQVRFPVAWPADRPELWRPFLERLLQRDSARRFASYDQLLVELRAWQRVRAPSAGRLARLIAWGLDNVIGQLMLVPIVILSILPGLIRGQIGSGGLTPAGILVLALLIYLHDRWGTSPGKRLMQLRIEDPFGARPGRLRLLLKALGTYALFLTWQSRVWAAWLASLVSAALAPPVKMVGDGVTGLGLLWVMANAVHLIFSRKRRTLLDRLLNVDVVLDVRSPDTTSPSVLPGQVAGHATTTGSPGTRSQRG